MNRLYRLLLVCWGMLLFTCKGDDTSVVLKPTNLKATTTIATDGTGLVSFLATSDNSVKYVFHFGEGLDEPVNVDDGKTSHMYVTSGTYNATVTAISKDNFSTDITVSVTVQVNEPPISATGYTTPLTYTGKTLVWQDEFTGTSLNTTDWNYETGPFNNELQYYKTENTSVHNGYLIIRAKVEKVAGKIYTSSRLTTENKKTFQYGRMDIRALMPKGKGMFPALWMLGNSFATIGWPKCGEIDIMETIGGGGRDSVVYGTAHWDSLGYVMYGGHKGLYNGQLLGDQFHVYSIEWTASEIRWYLDDKLYHVIDITPVGLTEFKKKFFFIFNLAIGGDWAGSPDATTIFPQRLVVDYIRVFQ